MVMEKSERDKMVSRWVRQPAGDGQARQEHAVGSVRAALAVHPAFRGTAYDVYARGAYPNQTNVAHRGLVDIVVECTDRVYRTTRPVARGDAPDEEPEGGDWAPDRWRREIEAALKKTFDSRDVVTRSSRSIVINEPGERQPLMRIVPSFTFERPGPDLLAMDRGLIHFDLYGNRTTSWPRQHLENGNAKDVATGGRFKQYARALKRVAGELAGRAILPTPGYFQECLVWNVPNDVLNSGNDLESDYHGLLTWLRSELDGDACRGWSEPSMRRRLFGGDMQAWSLGNARPLVKHALWMMEYA